MKRPSEEELLRIHLFKNAYEALIAHAGCLAEAMESVRSTVEKLSTAMDELAPYLHDDTEEEADERAPVVLHPAMVDHPSFSHRKN